MIASGLLSVVIAATTALPFTPPSLFTQMPASSMSQTVANVWHTGSAESFTTSSSQNALSVDAMVQALKAASGMMGLMQVESVTNARACGEDARVINVKVGDGSAAQTTTQELVAKDGYMYTLSYSRPIAAKADESIAGVMKSFCPGNKGEIPQLAPPTGWNVAVKSSIKTIGMWMGSSPGDMLLLMQGGPTDSLDSTVSTFGNQSLQSAKMPFDLKVVRHEETKLCGNPGLLMVTSMTMMSTPLTSEVIATQNATASYTLVYTHMGTTQPNADAEASLKTLCAK